MTTPAEATAHRIWKRLRGLRERVEEFPKPPPAKWLEIQTEEIQAAINEALATPEEPK